MYTPYSLLAVMSPARSSARVEQRLALHDAVEHPEPQRFLGVEAAAGEHELGGDGRADDAWQPVAAADVARRQPDPDELRAEERVVAGDAQVARRARSRGLRRRRRRAPRR